MIFDIRYMMMMVPVMILMMIVQGYVSSAYKKWSKVPARSRVTGAEAAARLASRGGLHQVQIEGVQGHLSDHYDPRSKRLRLSPGVYQGTSVAALAIAAHEMGHAMQDQEGYFYLRLRSALVPAVNIGSYLGWILILAGLVIGFLELAWLGVAVFSGGALFALATLPVELNASARAKNMLYQSGLITSKEEMAGVNHVLNAAALTYVAALIAAVVQLLYWVMVVMGARRR
jgi:uncharacterized protein